VTARKPVPWPLLKTGTVDVFKPIPFGTDVRGRKVSAPLIYHNWLVGSMPRNGKTGAMRELACAVALELLRTIEKQKLLKHIEKTGNYFLERLRDLQRTHPAITVVRGQGLMIGLDMSVPGKQMVLDAQAQGLLINCTHDTVLRFLPPYIVSEKEVDATIKILDSIFAAEASK